MPSQRDSRKKLVTTWMWDENHAVMSKYCNEHGITKTDFIEESLKSKFLSCDLDWITHDESKYSNRAIRESKD